jgi:HK97 family phage portal protein
MACLTLRGNFYAIKNRIGRGDRRRIVELLPVHPRYVEVKQDERWRLSYKIRFPGKAAWEIAPENILHVRGLSLDGVTGLSPIGYMRESIGLSLAAEKHGARLFKNGARPGGVLTVPGKLSDEAFARLKEQWQESFAGANVHKTAVLEEGASWAQLGMSNEDAQFLETRKFQRSEIAGIFRVPAHMVNDLERATFSNIEHMSRSFVTYSLMPWLVRMEQALWRDLLTEDEKRQGLYFKHNADGLLRGDSKSRAESLKTMREWGVINANEWRELEDMNPREDEGGETYLEPLNMGGGENSENTDTSE